MVAAMTQTTILKASMRPARSPIPAARVTRSGHLMPVPVLKRSCDETATRKSTISSTMPQHPCSQAFATQKPTRPVTPARPLRTPTISSPQRPALTAMSKNPLNRVITFRRSVISHTIDEKIVLHFYNMCGYSCKIHDLNKVFFSYNRVNSRDFGASGGGYGE